MEYPALQHHGLKIPSLPALDALARLAARRETRVWLCGGTLRDMLMGRKPPDLDLAVEGSAMDLAKDLAHELGGVFVPLKPEMDSCRVVAHGLELDLTGLRAPTLAGDLAARDFTINAMALELTTGQSERPRLIDPLNGQADLRKRRLRLASARVLEQDPVRVLRAFRFMSTHAMEPASGLMDQLSAAGPGLFRVAVERIATEWLKLMSGPRAGRAIAAMDQAGCLTRLAPSLAQGRGVEQNPFHHLDVLGHNLACLDALDQIQAEPVVHFGDLGNEIAAYLADEGRLPVLKTAALLHDLGKPLTRRLREPGYASFHNHDQAGARLALRTVKSLGLSKAACKGVAFYVAEHMRPFHLMGLWRDDRLTSRAVRRMIAAQGEHLSGIFALALADTIAGAGPQRPADAEEVLVSLYGRVAELRDAELAAALAAPPLINGHDLIKSLGLKPGPWVGRLLAAVREAQLDGEVSDADQALSLARRLMEQ